MKIYIIFYSIGADIYIAESRERAIELFKLENPQETWIDAYAEHIKEIDTIREGYAYFIPSVRE